MSQYTALKRDEMNGLIEQKEVLLRTNRIKNTLLSLFPKENRTDVVNQAQKLVRDGKIKEAIAVFETWVNVNGDTKLKNSLIAIKGQSAQIENEIQKGLISNDDAKLQKNRVMNSFLNLLNENTNADNSGYGESTKSKAQKKK